ncbi:GPI ethanolamine phosphate transferase 2 [Drosophila kikkawai]|uniref:GPI ethanolamine phosphate transferase 2 n=1 Tax=Drosophila kikkawai TaxID=30033 RepID=A0A6P4IP21_DROKI|nr:GPI ethanolamine phosphate transferase 2 [Drosophila kikkawai]
MEQHKSRLGYTLGMLSLFLLGAVLFLIGFFPASYSAAEKDSTVPEGRPTTLHGVKLEPPPPAYDSFILFLVDALRDDFPDATSMPVAHSRACEKLTLHVDIPTVTMPRLKSITTGTLSNFIDIALNVGHTEQVEDSILHRLKQKNRVVSFAGDHTWVNLFPSEFTRRAENNDSFYVNDFYEGDRNVTKVLESELEKSDWSLLILHYLGLDHIGHVEGNASPRINLKLKEMDEAVQKILEHKNLPNYLLMLTGDHGMADGGGHGGNTPAETLVPLYLYSKNCSKATTVTKTYNQIDLAPTLSVLLSVEIPTLSIGSLIPEMLQSLSLEHQLYAYFYNAHHLLNKARVKFGHDRVQWSDYYTWYQNATLVHKKLIFQMRDGDGSGASQVLYHNAKLNYMRVAREISGLLSESLVKFDYGFIALGLALTTAASLHMMISVLYLDLTEQLHLDSLNVAQLVVSLIAAVLVNMTSHALDIIRTSSWLQSLMLLIPLAIAVYLTIDVAQALLKIALPPIYTRRLKLSIPLPLPLLACFAIRTLTLGSSSFIEFEYKTWYYLGNSLILLTAFRTLRRRITKTNVELDGRHLYTIASTCLWQMRKVFVMLMLLTLMRYIHRLQAIRSTIMIFSLLLLWARLHRHSASWMQSVASGAALCMVYCFRGLNGQVHFIELAPYLASKLMVPTLVVFWCCLALVLGLGYREALPQAHPTLGTRSVVLQLLQTNLTSSLLLAALLQKVQNILLLPVLLVALQQTYKLCDVFGTSTRKFSVRLVHVYKIIMTIFLARMFYFYQGNSNSLSTIDLTPGYIGQTSYNPVIVGLFVTLNTYGAEIHAFLYLIVHTLRSDLRSVGIMQLQPPYSIAADSLIAPLYAALIMLPAAFYLCLMVGFRYHLFIYSVFSPKALYDCYTVLVFYLVFLVTSLYFKLFKNDA